MLHLVLKVVLALLFESSETFMFKFPGCCYMLQGRILQGRHSETCAMCCGPAESRSL